MARIAKHACCSMRKCPFSPSSSLAFRRKKFSKRVPSPRHRNDRHRPPPERRPSLSSKPGVDLVAASGFEAGGHRGSFLRPAEDSLTGTMSLVPQIVDAVENPSDSRRRNRRCPRHSSSFSARRAEAVQMGTIFLACEESGASALHREAILSGKANRTSLTRGFTGRLARGIHNQLLEEMNRPGVAILPYPLQRALMRSLAVPAQQAGRPEFLALWAGQSAGLAKYPAATALLQSLVNEVTKKLA